MPTLRKKSLTVRRPRSEELLLRPATPAAASASPLLEVRMVVHTWSMRLPLQGCRQLKWPDWEVAGPGIRCRPECCTADCLCCQGGH